MAPLVARSRPEAILYTLELWYGLILLVLFVVSIALNSILDPQRSSLLTQPAATGPGGRPLPATRRKSQDSSTLTFAPDLEISKTAKRMYTYTAGWLIFSFAANFASVISHTVHETKNPDMEFGWWCGEETSVYLISGLFLHLYVFIYLLEADRTPNKPIIIFWAATLAFEATIFLANVTRLSGTHQVLRSIVRNVWVTVHGPDSWDYLDMSIGAVRLFFVMTLLGVYLSMTWSRNNKRREKLEHVSALSSETINETTPLMSNEHAHATSYASVTSETLDSRTTLSCGDLESGGNGHTHGSANGSATASVHKPDSRPSDTLAKGTKPTAPCETTNFGYYEDEDTAFYRPEKLPHKTWWEYVAGYSLFFPYLWPRENQKLKLILVVCFGILLLQRVVNFLVPTQIGHITDAFENGLGMPWSKILLFIVYKMLQGESGVLGSCRALLWVPVSQFSYRALTTAAFEHVHSLSLDFHLGKRTGEVLSALNKGASINNFLEQVTFQVFPTLVDLFIAIVYFFIRFGAIYATIAAVITVFYLHMTVIMASTRADLRRDMVNADREEEAVKNDSISSYETVKYFNAEAYEFRRYRSTIDKYQEAEAKVTWGITNMNICQALVFMCGILVMLLIAAVEVTQGMRSIGDYVVMITYLGQLQGPLNYFGSFYRTVQQAMISGERLLELFKIQASVVDKPAVYTLPQCSGHIKWDHVKFAYHEGSTALRDLSFECSPGTTTAFVGESGGGKSTIFRLMFRYYNCQSGTIAIDGHDVKDVTIDSVRRHIGVVPQDTILFNETIMYNLRYANPSATDEEIFEACRAASIHDRIISFPHGYNTKVGDRGTRLSGGEKQRVAIARTILKNPKIIMLDEATSALDSETEQQIQGKLIRGGSLGQDRTVLIIAHRLSTITHADQIIVLHSGKIVEKGTHAELLTLRGRYASMWESQSQAEEAAWAARYAAISASKLIQQAHMSGPGEGGDNHSDGYTSLASSTILGAGMPTPPRQGSIRQGDDLSDDDSQPPTTTK